MGRFLRPRPCAHHGYPGAPGRRPRRTSPGSFQRARAADLTPEEIQAAALLEEAKWAFGIVEPRPRMGTQPDCEGIPARVFQAYTGIPYGERVVQDITRRIQEI